MEFHKWTHFVFDVHPLFALPLALPFPLPMCSAGARVHDLSRCVLRHLMEPLSTGISEGLAGL